MDLDRCWFLTWTTYGTWLPGDPRGNVTSVKDGSAARHRHNRVGTPFDGDMSGLRKSAERQLKGAPVYLVAEQAQRILDQFQETSEVRKWMLIAVAIMRNHVHLEVGVPGDPDPEVMLRDYKAYASRVLNARWPRPTTAVRGGRRVDPNEN